MMFQSLYLITVRSTKVFWFFCLKHPFFSLVLFAISSTFRVLKVSFGFLDKLKYEIRNKVLIFVSVLKLRLKT